MLNVASAHYFFRYSDWANGQILERAAHLSDAQLDQPFEIGLGALRRTLVHIYNGEFVWLNRWQGRAETKWPSESEPVAVAMLNGRSSETWKARDAFLATLSDADLSRMVTYRDSKGTLYQAALGDMMMQMIVHSLHHRAQVVNMFRRLGLELVELDYMYWVRQPA